MKNSDGIYQWVHEKYGEEKAAIYLRLLRKVQKREAAFKGLMALDRLPYDRQIAIKRRLNERHEAWERQP